MLPGTKATLSAFCHAGRLESFGEVAFRESGGPWVIFAMGHVGETTSPDGVGDKADPTVRTHVWTFRDHRHSAMLHMFP